MAEKLCMGCMETYSDQYDICPYCGYVDGTAPKEAYHLIPGTVIEGRYIVGKVIGNGGFGITYIGYDAVLNQKIAIKEYLPGEFSTRTMGTLDVTVFSGKKEEQFANGIVKFIDEAKKLAKFKHTQGIVDIHDSFQANHTAYIIMEYLDGETLKEKLEREGKIPLDEALNIMMPVLDALKEVHKVGILHRDISPDNIMITKSGEVKIIDFGAARFATTTHSRSISVLVKPGYAPEEQYRSRGDQGPWTDVYSCAATLYKMLTGVTPDDVMERKYKDNLLPPSKLGVKIPKNKENAIMNAMNIQIEDRTQSVESFEVDLSTDEDIKRNKIRIKKKDIGKWPIWLKITSGAVATTVAIFIVLLLTGVIKSENMFHMNRGDLKEGYVYAPNVQNHELVDAEKEVEKAKLIMQITDKQHSDEIEENMVLNQNIPEGTVVQEETVMEIVVSAGYKKGFMPDITGLLKEDVIELLVSMGWDEKEIKIQDVESEIAPGYVAMQDIEEGEEIKIGDEITLYVSKGLDGYDESKSTVVPDLINKSWEDAKTAVSTSKLYLFKSGTDYSNTVPRGNIISQDPISKNEVIEGTNIGVIISLGKKEDATVHVPDVQYKSRSEAIALLESQGLEVQSKNEESTSVQKDHVIRQSVESGQEVPVGTLVVIYISLGNPNAVITYDPETSSYDPATTSNDQNNKDNNHSSTTNNTTGENVDTTDNNSSQEVNVPYPEDPVQPEPEEGKIIVPNLIGKTEAEARESLENEGLFVGSITYQHAEGTSAGIVLYQGVEPGTNVAKDSVINIVVCDNTKITYYRYRDVVRYDEKTSTTSSTPPTGYEYVKSEDNITYGDWGNWSDWSPNAISSSDTCDVQAESGAVCGRYYNPQDYTSNDKNVNGICTRYEYYRPWSWLGKMTPFQWYSGGTERWSLINEGGGIAYRNVSGSGEWTWSGTVYRYRQRSKTTTTKYYFRMPVYGSWSSWSTEKPTVSSTREIETSEEYMY